MRFYAHAASQDIRTSGEAKPEFAFLDGLKTSRARRHPHSEDSSQYLGAIGHERSPLKSPASPADNAHGARTYGAPHRRRELKRTQGIGRLWRRSLESRGKHVTRMTDRLEGVRMLVTFHSTGHPANLRDRHSTRVNHDKWSHFDFLASTKWHIICGSCLVQSFGANYEHS